MRAEGCRRAGGDIQVLTAVTQRPHTASLSRLRRPVSSFRRLADDAVFDDSCWSRAPAEWPRAPPGSSGGQRPARWCGAAALSPDDSDRPVGPVGGVTLPSWGAAEAKVQAEGGGAAPGAERPEHRRSATEPRSGWRVGVEARRLQEGTSFVPGKPPYPMSAWGREWSRRMAADRGVPWHRVLHGCERGYLERLFMGDAHVLLQQGLLTT